MSCNKEEADEIFFCIPLVDSEGKTCFIHYKEYGTTTKMETLHFLPIQYPIQSHPMQESLQKSPYSNFSPTFLPNNCFNHAILFLKWKWCFNNSPYLCSLFVHSFVLFLQFIQSIVKAVCHKFQFLHFLEIFPCTHWCNFIKSIVKKLLYLELDLNLQSWKSQGVQLWIEYHICTPGEQQHTHCIVWKIHW